MKTIKHLSEHKNKLIYLAVTWSLLVIFACLVRFNKVPKIKIENIDKLVHGCFHFGIAFLWFLYFAVQKNNPFKKAAIQAGLISLFLGIGIELCQQIFTTSRKADFFDVLANCVGALLAIGFLFFTSNSIQRLFQKV